MELFTYLMAKNDHNTSVNKDLFSYLLGKNQSGTYTDYSGTSLSINNTKKGKMKVNLLGNTNQTGTPTPSSPIPVNVVSGDNTVTTTGKNLAPMPTNTNEGHSFPYTSNGVTINFISGGHVRLSGQATAITSLFTFRPNEETESIIVPAGTYTFSAVSIPSGVKIIMSGGGNNGFSYAELTSNSLSTTSNVTDGTKPFNYITFRIDSGTNFGTGVDIYYQLESGSSATSWEPYTSTSYPIHLGEHWLGWIGNYKDGFFKAINGNNTYDNLDSATKESLTYGEWYLEKKIGKVVLDGSENWDVTSTDTSSVYRRMTTVLAGQTISPTSASQVGLMLCNRYLAKSASDTYLKNVGVSMARSGYLEIYDSDFTTVNVSSYKTWLSSNNVILYYVLATPTYTQITGTLKDELEAVWRANSYNGTTNISQVNNDLPFNMNVSVKVGS